MKKETIIKDNDIIQQTAGLWKDYKGTGVEYERNIRKGWKKRLKREIA